MKHIPIQRRSCLLPSSQLVMRHSHLIQGTNVLVINCSDDGIGAGLTQKIPGSRFTFFHFDYAAHRGLRQAFAVAGLGAEGLVYGAWYAVPEQRHDTALVFLPKSRALLEMTLSMIGPALLSDAKVFLVGENSSSIRASRAALTQWVGQITCAHAGRHCMLYQARRDKEGDDVGSGLNRWAQHYICKLRDVTLNVVTFPGTFSHGRLDAGTRFFLEHLHVRPDSRVLDIGCGAGIIGALVSRLWPRSRVDFVDTDALALEATRWTLRANGLTDAASGVWPSDVFSDVRGSYDHIVSNPPFHTGIRTNYRMAEELIQQAPHYLEAEGTLQIAANRFLPYPSLLERHFKQVRAVAQDTCYRIYLTSKN